MSNYLTVLGVAAAAVWPALALATTPREEQEALLGPLTEPLWQLFEGLNRLLPWIGGCLAVIAIVLLVAHRLRLHRRATRVAISGLRNGPRFRVVDAMCHAIWKASKIDETRLARALEIARNTTEMDFTKEHLREIAIRADRVIVPTNFLWMRDGLTASERMVIFNASVSVLLAGGPLSRSDRAFLRTVARGLGLGHKDLRDLAALITA
ncbi:hypothetical protein SAMN05444004_1148 [Jannaschia faecimaris]|uniref:Tellurite resistance protein TerB n=1 Tax=Jannaschia faecimaris TaxID=1244108 RepID=A0A1H3SWV8_9RHOB|nr:hypothetical protein [Jannaschia faecimaris]SDZ42167.1 hypothetical protein SAMN05444004_1148 [Jannaschia faecimaris]